MPKAPIVGCTLVEPGAAHTDFRNRSASVDQEPRPRRIALGSDACQLMRAQLCARLDALEARTRTRLLDLLNRARDA